MGPLNVFAGANRVLADSSGGAATAPYSIVTASPGGRPVRTAWGLLLTPDADLGTMQAPHTLVVPGRPPDPNGTIPTDPEVVAWLRRHGARTPRIVSVCTGTFLLAEAGLLVDRRVTTHWSQADKLAAEHPEARICPEPVFVRDEQVSTSAGATSGIDLALDIVEEDLGRDMARTIARYMVVFLRRPGSQPQISNQLRAQLANRPPLREVQHWIADHPDADLSVEALARRAHLSPRQFTRAFTAETGTPPGRFVDRARLETAQRMLEDTQDSIEQVACASGYANPETMRRAFQRALGISPTQYRQRC